MSFSFEMSHLTEQLIHYNKRMMNTPVTNPRLSQLATYEEEHCYYDNTEDEDINCYQEEIYEFIYVRQDMEDSNLEECSVYDFQ